MHRNDMRVGVGMVATCEGEVMLGFATGQLGITADEAYRYAVTGTTRYRHSAEL